MLWGLQSSPSEQKTKKPALRCSHTFRALAQCGFCNTFAKVIFKTADAEKQTKVMIVRLKDTKEGN